MNYVVIWGAIAITSAVLAAMIAPMKNRDWSAWAAWCFLFPPLVIALVLTPKNTGPRRRQPTLDQLDRHDDRVM